jgi:hypothetical protein
MDEVVRAIFVEMAGVLLDSAVDRLVKLFRRIRRIG